MDAKARLKELEAPVIPAREKIAELGKEVKSDVRTKAEAELKVRAALLRG